MQCFLAVSADATELRKYIVMPTACDDASRLGRRLIHECWLTGFMPWQRPSATIPEPACIMPARDALVGMCAAMGGYADLHASIPVSAALRPVDTLTATSKRMIAVQLFRDSGPQKAEQFELTLDLLNDVLYHSLSHPVPDSRPDVQTFDFFMDTDVRTACQYAANLKALIPSLKTSLSPSVGSTPSMKRRGVWEAAHELCTLLCDMWGDAVTHSARSEMLQAFGSLFLSQPEAQSEFLTRLQSECVHLQKDCEPGSKDLSAFWLKAHEFITFIASGKGDEDRLGS